MKMTQLDRIALRHAGDVSASVNAIEKRHATEIEKWSGHAVRIISSIMQQAVLANRCMR
jgi:hypothetical protein